MTSLILSGGHLVGSSGALCATPTGQTNFPRVAVLFNEWGNGTQTVTASQVTTAIGGNYKLLNGTQQPLINTGAAFSSYVSPDGDGLMLVNA